MALFGSFKDDGRHYPDYKNKCSNCDYKTIYRSYKFCPRCRTKLVNIK